MSILLGGWRALGAAALVMLVVAMAAPASAQLRSSVAVSGLSNPVAFVQDPSNAAVQYVVQLGGVIRVVQNGTLLSTPLANLSTQISTGGERGLLGLAFPPNYASSGRFYVCFTNPSGHIVVARLRRSSANPLVCDRIAPRSALAGREPLHHASALESQRRQHRLRSRRLPVRRHRRRRRRQRSRSQRAEPGDAPGQDAAHQRRGPGWGQRGLRRSADQSVRRAERLSAGDLEPGPAQPVALELRQSRRSAARARW